MNRLLFIGAFVFICFSGFAQQVITPHDHLGVTFTENVGQWENKILFRAGLDGGALFLENDKLTFHFYDKNKARQFHFNKSVPKTFIDDQIKTHAYQVLFEGCNANSLVDKIQKGSYYENYFIDNDHSRWKGGVSNYHQVLYRNLYNNIDYEIITSANNIKYNFYVKPNGNVNDIKLKYEGIENIHIKNGFLFIKPNINELFEQKPYAYQVIDGITKEVPCNFVLKNKTVSYNFPKGYNKNYELIIDPLLVFAAQSGSTADNFGMTATYDAQGNLYSGGIIFNIGYPTTIGAYSSSFFGPELYGNTDVVITKYNSTGNSLLYSTYFGGTQTETVNSLIIDKNDNLCFYGVTSSSDFPITNSAYDNTYNGGSLIFFYNNGHRFNYGTDIFVAKFSSNGSSLLGCTYIGGSENDGINHSNKYLYYLWSQPFPSTNNDTLPEPRYDSLQYNYGDHSRGEIQIDGNNNIYVTSSTRSANFPTINSFDNTLGGKQDGVVFKFNSNLTTLLFSSFIGGSSMDSGNGIIIDNTSDIYVTGGTTSADFPFTAGGYQSTYQGGKADGYVLRISPTGNTVLNGTYFGTPAFDQSYFIQSDKQKNIYIYGQSLGNIPVISAVTSPTVFNVPKTHQFISRFNKTLTTLNMSTVFGHDTLRPDISPSAFSVDKCSNIYLSGWGSSLFSQPTLSNMPLMLPTQSTTDGSDFYFMGLDSNASTLKYGSYFGGNLSREHVDGGTSRFDPLGKIYQSVCAGCGGNDDFPVTPGAWPGTPGNTNYSSNCNNGVIKIDFELLVAVSTINTNTLSGCAPLTVNFTNASPGNSYLWYLQNNDTSSVIANPVITYTNPGTYSVSLVIYTPSSCNIKDSAVTFITVYPKPVSAFTTTYSPCSNTITTTNNSTGSGTYIWDWGDSSPTSTLTAPSHTYAANGTYTMGLSISSIDGCISKSTETISVFNFTTSVSSSTICFGASTTLTASGGTDYLWSPPSLTSNSVSANPVTSPTTTTTFTVQIDNNSPGYVCSQTRTTQVVVNPGIVSDFNYTVVPCTDTVSFISTSTTSAPTQTITWQFGGGQATSTNTAITQTYGNGTYSVILTAINNFGCKDSVTKTLSVFNFTTGIVSKDTICRGFTSLLNASGGTSYTWSPASQVSNPFIASPVTTPSATTIYSVSIENNSPGYTCSKTLTTSIVAHPKITTAFTYSIGACSNDVQFTDASFNNPVSWTWDFGDSNSSTAQSPLYFYNVSGTYTASLISTNNFGCKDTSSQVLILPAFTPISVNGTLVKCELDTVQLTATGGVMYSWQPSQTLSNSTIFNPLAFPSSTTIYTVTVSTLKGLDTCKSQLTTTVSILPFSYNTSLITVNPSTLTLGQSANVTLNGLPVNSTITVVPDAQVALTGNNTFVVTPSKSGEYTIYATDANNCKHALKTIYVEVITNVCNEGVVYLPTGFTPNSDGANDILYIRSNFITDVYLTIYDRWGEKLFETNDVKKGWDGTYKGKQLDQGVYGYYMTFTCNNGEQSFKKGNITLMK